MFGVEKRYPLTALPPLRKRLGHIGTNLGLWLYSIILVDLGLGAFIRQQPWVEQLASMGLLARLELPPFWLIFVSLLIIDLLTYTSHYLMHRIPWLWRFHSVHHSDASLDVSSTFRFHPVEVLFTQMWLLSFVLLIGIPVWLIALWNLIILPLSLMQHANVDITNAFERSLRPLLVTPGLHKIHHSPRQAETDSNYGSFLSVWDRLLGTLVPESAAENPRYGLNYLDDANWQSVWGMLRTPWSEKFRRNAI